MLSSVAVLVALVSNDVTLCLGRYYGASNVRAVALL